MYIQQGAHVWEVINPQKIALGTKVIAIFEVYGEWCIASQTWEHFWGQPVNILLWIYTFSVFRDSIVLEQLAIKPLTCCEKNIRFNGNLHQTSTAGGCFRILLIFVSVDIFTVISEYFLHVHSNIIPLKTVWSSSFVISGSKKGNYVDFFIVNKTWGNLFSWGLQPPTANLAAHYFSFNSLQNNNRMKNKGCS